MFAGYLAIGNLLDCPQKGIGYMHIVYIDDSADEKLSVFSALVIPEDSWLDVFAHIKGWRKRIKESDGIYVYKELHAWKFVSGRGNIASNVVPKSRRCELFVDALKTLALVEVAQLFNAVAAKDQKNRLFERLLNRINRTMEAWGSHAILVIDEGSELEFTRLYRKMSVYNPIPSSHGVWKDTGEFTKNIPLDRIIEDPFFKDSRRSYFIQFVDFCAYALLRRENPVESKSRYGLDKAFNELNPILFTGASRRDPEGIIRI